MSDFIDAIYDHGILRPSEPLALPEGTRVRLRVEHANGATTALAEYRTWIDTLAGRWQGDFTRAASGDLESREPLS